MQNRFLSILMTTLLLCSAGANAQMHQVAIVDLPGRPGFDGMAWANGSLLIAHAGAGTVDVFNPAKRRLIAQVTGLASPRSIAVDERAGVAYILNAGDRSLVVLNTKTWAAESKINLSICPGAALLVTGAEGTRLYVAGQHEPVIMIVGFPENREIAKFATDGLPRQMVFDAAQKRILFTLQDKAEVGVVPTEGMKPQQPIVARYKLNASQPTGIALDEAQRRLFVAVRSAIVVLDPATGNELTRIAAPQGIDSLSFDAEDRVLLAVSSDGTLQMIRGDNNQFKAEELRTEVRGHSLAYDPQRNFIFVPGGRDGKSKLVILKTTPGNVPGTINALQPATSATGQSLARESIPAPR